jgi:hypothetical protein
MRHTSRAGIPVLLAVAVLLALAPAPAGAITLQRTWWANVSSGTNGKVTLKAYTNGVGSISYALRKLRANSSYAVQIRKGSCAHLGTVVQKVASVHTSSTGSVARTVTVFPSQMRAIWPAARGTSFAIRLVSGSSVRCAGFTFHKATRIVISSLGINLPIVRGPSGYPYCRVAMYLSANAQPREPGITYIFAHARTGMFLPLLTQYRLHGAAGLLGRYVKVYTNDSYVSYYKIDKVRKTLNATAGVTTLTTERLWLQTSTGPNTSYPKLVAEAYRYKTLKTTYAASHPTPHPINC